jgi:hypothetical protein
MSRTEFFRKLGRYILLLLIAVVVFALGSKVVTANECSGCPGNGVCSGKTDCDKY